MRDRAFRQSLPVFQTAAAEGTAAAELCRFRDGFSYPPAEFDLVTCAWCYAYAGASWFPAGRRLQIGEHWYRRTDGAEAVTYVSCFVSR